MVMHYICKKWFMHYSFTSQSCFTAACVDDGLGGVVIKAQALQVVAAVSPSIAFVEFGKRNDVVNLVG